MYQSISDMKKIHKNPSLDWILRHLRTINGLIVILAITLSGCRKDDLIIPEEIEPLPPQNITAVAGFYLLNEGNMNMNKASLDYYDYATGYRRNIYGQANPQATLGLGDVGNDLKIYGSKLYTVINYSNKVEVMDAATTKRLKVIDIKNCRYITFANGKAYVSAYDGEVQLGTNSPNGFVAEIDTATLSITRTIQVGRQPEELAVVGNKLYVANSGCYSPPNFERTVTVIDLNTFTKIRDIDIAPNLHRVRTDGRGNLYVSSRGDSFDIPSKLFIIDPETDTVRKTFDRACANLSIAGDTVYVIGSAYNYATNEQTVSYYMIDIRTETLLDKSFLPNSVSDAIQTPYGIAVDPFSNNIYITDATDYVSPGKLYCIDTHGNTVFTVTTGDIPAHIAFVTKSIVFEDEPPVENSANCITKVFEYCPAPGQFINTLPESTDADTPEMMRQKAETALTNGGMICLGGFGGYVVFGFDHSIVNTTGNDFVILGNAGINGAEPGIIMVSYDANGNGLPDDAWYEIAGSAYHKPTTVRNYEITYFKPASEPSPNEPNYIRWTDNRGQSGYIAKNSHHTQTYYPSWMGDSYTLKGTLMEATIYDQLGTGMLWVSPAYDWGYADNWPNTDVRAQIDIDWAVDIDGNPVTLKGIDFVKVYTGNRAEGGWIGEISTEITGFVDLNN